MFLALIIPGCSTLTFQNLLIENSEISEVHFIGCNNIKISNLEVKNNSRTGCSKRKKEV